MTAPVQVLVLGLDREALSDETRGEVLAEAARLRDAGIVRFLDLLLISRAEDGTLEVEDAPAWLPAGTGRLAAELLGRPGASPPDQAAIEPSPDEPTWSLADAVPVGTTAVVVLIEHTWAAPLRSAVRRSGGAALDETWLAGADLDRLEELLSARQPALTDPSNP